MILPFGYFERWPIEYSTWTIIIFVMMTRFQSPIHHIVKVKMTFPKLTAVLFYNFFLKKTTTCQSNIRECSIILTPIFDWGRAHIQILCKNSISKLPCFSLMKWTWFSPCLEWYITCDGETFARHKFLKIKFDPSASTRVCGKRRKTWDSSLYAGAFCCLSACKSF